MPAERAELLLAELLVQEKGQGAVLGGEVERRPAWALHAFSSFGCSEQVNVYANFTITTVKGKKICKISFIHKSIFVCKPFNKAAFLSMLRLFFLDGMGKVTI